MPADIMELGSLIFGGDIPPFWRTQENSNQKIALNAENCIPSMYCTSTKLCMRRQKGDGFCQGGPGLSVFITFIVKA